MNMESLRDLARTPSQHHPSLVEIDDGEAFLDLQTPTHDLVTASTLNSHHLSCTAPPPATKTFLTRTTHFVLLSLQMIDQGDIDMRRRTETTETRGTTEIQGTCVTPEILVRHLNHESTSRMIRDGQELILIIYRHHRPTIDDDNHDVHTMRT